ncbi:hypothetical protein BJX64DRAFT_284835 [Aspergillus heterothallicus]
MATGVPPEDYVFVWFYPYGYSLAHEDDLKLIDRPMMLGMGVKRHADDAMAGQVINSTSRCTLEPIAYQPVDLVTGEYLPVKFTQKLFGGQEDFLRPEDPAGIAVVPNLLFEVPQTELTGYEEFAEDDYIIYRQKLGVIREVEHDAILLLPDAVVVSPLSTAALELPLCVYSDDILSMPESKYRDLGDGKYVRTMYTEDIQPGQAILTDSSNLYQNKFAAKERGESIQAHLLAAPIEDIRVDWLCPNVFSSKTHERGPSSEDLRLSTLQGNAIKCNFAHAPGHDSPALGYGAVFAIGELVRFCDPANAATKYREYRHLPSDQTFGHDINIFRIVSTRTEAVVRWQDGSCTNEATVSLHRFDTAEDHLWPGKYVALKDGVRTVDRPCLSSVQGRAKETIHVPKVGVIQAVDSREQIASIRWFRNSGVELIHGGSAMDPRSSMGTLEDDITEVSVYELAILPALNKSLGDLAILAPTSIDQAAMSSSTFQEGADRTKFSTPGAFQGNTDYLQFLKSEMVESEWFRKTTTTRTPPLRRRYSIQSNEPTPKIDFVGKIVAMDLNGEITVRLPGHNNCYDTRIPLERIMMVISSDDLMPAGPSGPKYGDNFDESCTDSDWDTEDESIGSVDSNELTSLYRATDPGTKDKGQTYYTQGVLDISCEDTRLHCETTSNVCAFSTPTVRFPMPTSCPPPFTVLEGSPPLDHRFIAQSDTGLFGARMKYIQKEFDILNAALPSGVFVRTWESRMDLLRVMMIGPEGTPYEHAPFVIDFAFTPVFPSRPPLAFFHSWTNGQGRINPNMYEDGKICLSLLGTWPTRNPEETWVPGRSTVLQILVSIMGLVLVKAPFYNEAGYEVLGAQNHNRVESALYTEKAFLMTRTFILHALECPVSGFEDVLAWHYIPGPSSTRPQLLRKAIREALEMVDHHNCTAFEGNGEELRASAFLPRLSLGAVVMLKRHVSALQSLELDLHAPQSS